MNFAAQSVFPFLRVWRAELLWAVVLVVIIPLGVAYLVLAERKLGAGLLARIESTGGGLSRQIFRAVRTLLTAEKALENSDVLLFYFAPLISVAATLAALAAFYAGPALRVADNINIGILFAVATSSLGVIGVLLSSGSSCSSAIRNTAQLVGFEIAAVLAIVSGLLFCGSLRISVIIEAQSVHRVWFIFLAPVAFYIYFIASLGTANRVPPEVPEAGSELIAGYLAGRGGLWWSLYLLTEYANIVVVACVATTLFLGGWLRPFANVRWLNWLDYFPMLVAAFACVYFLYRAGKQPKSASRWLGWAMTLAALVVTVALGLPMFVASLRFAIPEVNGAFWFFLKMAAYIFLFLRLRFTLPREFSDHSIFFGWYALIPVAFFNILSVGVAMWLEAEFGWNRWLALALTTAATLVVFALLVRWKNLRAGALTTSAVISSDFYAG
jgi:NADH-quinone oxidoreductase subunit H